LKCLPGVLPGQALKYKHEDLYRIGSSSAQGLTLIMGLRGQKKRKRKLRKTYEEMKEKIKKKLGKKEKLDKLD